MSTSYRRHGGAIIRDDLPIAIRNADDRAIWNLPGLQAWWRGDHDTMMGIDTADPFVWPDRRYDRRLTPAKSAYEPIPVVENGFDGLSFGVAPLTDANNGNLMSPAGVSLIDASQSAASAVCYAAVVSFPPGGGGAIIGAKLNQSDDFGNANNVRWHGLQVGYGTTPGKPRFCFHGDFNYAAPASAVDYRDGALRLIVGGWDGAGQTSRIRVNRAQLGSTSSLSGGNPTYLNPTLGTQEVRVGATGLASDPNGTNTLIATVYELLVFSLNYTSPADPAWVDGLALFEGRLSELYNLA